MTRLDEPRLDRSIRLNLMGDWGLANFHRVCGWLSNMAIDRTGSHTRVAIWNGTGGIDNVQAVGRGEVDLAIMTPAQFMPAALTGNGPFAEEAFPGLRALGVLRQDDAMVFALASSLGISTFEELHLAKPPLRIAVSPDDGKNLIGYGGHRHLEALGLDRVTVESWGGCYVERLMPHECAAAVVSGQANAIMQEAIMGPWWHEAVEKAGLRLLSSPDEALNRLEDQYGWKRRVIPAGHFASQQQPVTTLDFADFLVLVSTDMTEDVAYLLTWCLVETRLLLERQYHHIPPERSPLTYPLEPARMAVSPIPLHAGARRYYTAAGVLDD